MLVFMAEGDKSHLDSYVSHCLYDAAILYIKFKECPMLCHLFPVHFDRMFYRNAHAPISNLRVESHISPSYCF